MKCVAETCKLVKRVEPYDSSFANCFSSLSLIRVLIAGHGSSIHTMDLAELYRTFRHHVTPLTTQLSHAGPQLETKSYHQHYNDLSQILSFWYFKYTYNYSTLTFIVNVSDEI